MQRWDQALSIAGSIEDGWYHALALIDIAGALIKANDTTAAQALLEEATTIAHSIDDVEQQEDAFRAIAVTLAALQQWDQALSIAQFIEMVEEQIPALTAIVVALAQAQQWLQAEAVAQYIQDTKLRADALTMIAAARVKAGDAEAAQMLVDKTITTVRSGKDIREQAQAFASIASALVETPQWERAQGIAHVIEPGWERVYAQQEVAIVLGQAGYREAAQALLNETATTARAMRDTARQPRALQTIVRALADLQRWDQAHAVARSIEDAWDRTEALRELALALVKVGQAEMARGLLDEASTLAQEIEYPDLQTEALKEIAIAFAKAQYWEQAQTATHAIEDPGRRVYVQQDIAGLLAHAGHIKDAQTLLHDVLTTAQAIRNVKLQAHVLQELALLLFKTGNVQAAQVLLDEAAFLPDVPMQDWEHPSTLKEIVGVLAETQQWDRALSIAHSIKGSWNRAKAFTSIALALAEDHQWEQCQVVVHSIEDIKWRADALRELVVVLIKVGQGEAAQALLDEAFTAVRSLRDVSLRAEALKDLAETLIKIGQTETAQALLDEAFTTMCSAKDEPLRTETLEELAITLAEMQHWEQAEALAYMIDDLTRRAKILKIIAGLFKADLYQVLALVQRAWTGATTRAEALLLVSVATPIIIAKPAFAETLIVGTRWVQAFLNGEQGATFQHE